MMPPTPIVTRTDRGYPHDRLIWYGALSPGDEGVEETMAALVASARVAAAMPGADLAHLARACSRTSLGTRGRCVYELLRDCIMFRRDPRGVELLRDPDQLAAEIVDRGRTCGDCDEGTALGCALLLLCGLGAAAVCVSVDERPYHHVFPAATGRDGHGRTSLWPMDAQERIEPGRWPAGIARARVWLVSRAMEGRDG